MALQRLAEKLHISRPNVSPQSFWPFTPQTYCQRLIQSHPISDVAPLISYLVIRIIVLDLEWEKFWDKHRAWSWLLTIKDPVDEHKVTVDPVIKQNQRKPFKGNIMKL